VVTIGGLYATTLSQIDGILIGDKPETLARDSTIPKIPLAVLCDWATEQAQIIDGEGLHERESVRSAAAIMALGGNAGALPFALKDEEGVNPAKIRKLLSNSNEIRVYEDLEVDYEEELDDMHARVFNDGFEANPEIPTASIFGWAASGVAPTRPWCSAARGGADAALQTFGADEIAVTLR
jgi:hypothetical protein